jgi:phospholipase C
MSRTRALVGLLLAAAAVTAVAVLATGIAGAAPTGTSDVPHGAGATATPIKHLVVIFQENVSFDHYFGTYPDATGADGQPFSARPGTPAVDGLTPATDASIPVPLRHTADLTASNPNSALPKRLDSSPDGLPGDAGGAETCDQDHNYSDEQQSFDGGAMDQFVQSVGTDGGSRTPNGAALCQAATVMDYYDGNTLTALWNYAQHYSMSDNSFGTTFGPSAPGAINVVSGDTGGVDTGHESTDPPATSQVSIATASAPNADITPDGQGGFSLTSDAQPYWDDCSTRDAVALSGKNIGDELNAAGLSWGWFQGGFRPTTTFAAASTATGHPNQPTSTFIPDEFSGSFPGKVTPPASTTGLPSGLGTTANQALCDAYHPIGVALGASGTTASTAPWGFKDDYIPHHEPFEYYATTANPHHLSIATDGGGDDQLHGSDSLSNVGTDTQSFSGAYGVGPQFDTPNHNYDTSDFDQLVAAIDAGKLPASDLPAVTFLKAPGYQDGHAQYSNPLDEQAFVVGEVNALMKSPDWSSTAVLVNYDDSDGWYDHVYSGVTNPSQTGADNLTGTKLGKISAANPTSGKCGTSGTPLGGQNGRCGLGPRLPMIAISPCAAPDAVDHDLSDQASVVNFIEYNWHLPAIAGSFDQALAGTDRSEGVPFDLAGLFDFSHCDQPALPLSPKTGQIDLAGTRLNGDHQGDDFANGDLSNAKLATAQFQGAFLPGADLSGADLRVVEAEGADLAGDDLTNAKLDDAKLQGANLAGADLTGASARIAQLQGADLQGANLTGADLRLAKLTGANLRGVTWSNTTCPDGTNSSSDGGTCQGHLSLGP